MKRILKIIAVLIIMALIIVGLGKLLWSQKVATFIASYYELQGVDVSHFQGNIDWEVLKDQGISFAYIKATEGSGHVDTPNFFRSPILLSTVEGRSSRSGARATR